MKTPGQYNRRNPAFNTLDSRNDVEEWGKFPGYRRRHHFAANPRRPNKTLVYKMYLLRSSSAAMEPNFSFT